MKTLRSLLIVSLVSANALACSSKPRSALSPDLSGTLVAESQDDAPSDSTATLDDAASPASGASSGLDAAVPTRAAPLAGQGATEPPAAGTDGAAGAVAAGQPVGDAATPDASLVDEEEEDDEDEEDDDEDEEDDD